MAALQLTQEWDDSDESSCVDGFGAGLILTNLEGAEFTYALRFRFVATNNEAEYEALITGLRIAEQIGVKNLQTIVDSHLVANQVNGSYIAKEPGMIQYLEKVKTLTSSLKKFSIKQVPLSENKKAHALSKIVSTSFVHLTKEVLVEELNEKSINEGEVLAIVEELGNTWMTPIYEYLMKEHSVQKGRRQEQSGLSQEDARKVIWECQECQLHRPVPRNPQQKLTPITSPWPFYKWRIDIAEPFPEGPDRVKFLIVAMDYFTKWIEAKPVATITVEHNTDECMHLKRQIEELIKAGKLSHVIKELKQGSEKDQPKAAKKGEAYGKDKAMAILMVQPWQRVARQRIT
ncbi:reverse transcriptase domain-containing protein [Tanacetum coccineum]|uniref:Reverse transcriptase domain-containing protein n=1 Tax=Tanacetum coccineum TaxID=301880 RepID=A0ABQ4YFF4_9ASTR